MSRRISGSGRALNLLHWLVKVSSGTLSDYLGKRKQLVLFGYVLGALTKPLFALASGLGLLLTARLLDRVGKGVCGAPRDALIAVAPHVVWSRFWGHPSNPPAELLIDGDEDRKLFHTAVDSRSASYSFGMI